MRFCHGVPVCAASRTAASNDETGGSSFRRANPTPTLRRCGHWGGRVHLRGRRLAMPPWWPDAPGDARLDDRTLPAFRQLDDGYSWSLSYTSAGPSASGKQCCGGVEHRPPDSPLRGPEIAERRASPTPEQTAGSRRPMGRSGDSIRSSLAVNRPYS